MTQGTSRPKVIPSSGGDGKEYASRDRNSDRVQIVLNNEINDALDLMNDKMDDIIALLQEVVSNQK